MIFRSKCRVVSLIVVAVVSASHPVPIVRAQKEKEAEQRQELEKKTLALLNEVASGAWGLKLPENRVFVMASAADLLWQFDEKRARSFYWDALNSLSAPRSITTPVRNDAEKLSREDRQKFAQDYFAVYRLRQKILRQIARRDPQLAMEMLRATRQVPPRQTNPSEWQYPDDSELEQEIASAATENDPTKALQIARQSLAKGLTLQSLTPLYNLLAKHPEKATQYAGDIIDKLRTTNIAADLRASLIGLHLLVMSRSRDGNRSPAEPAIAEEKRLNLNDEQRRDLVELLTDAALSASPNSTLLNEMSDVMPEIDQFFPERREALDRKLATFGETLNKDQRDQNLYNTLIRQGRQEELVRAALTTNEADRQHLYNQAALIALARNQTESFRDFVNKEVSDKGERTRIFDYLESEEITAAASRKQIDVLRNLAPKIQRKEERARALAELALLLNEKGESAEASSLLDEAATLIKTDLKDDKQTNALLALLCAYAIVDPPKAFAVAERTVDRANSQISLLMLLDRVAKSGVVKKNEIVLDQAGILPLDYLFFKYGKGVSALAKADFNRTRALAGRFERNELRLLAQLLIVKGVLQPPLPPGGVIEMVQR